jgi:hypothetical protein
MSKSRAKRKTRQRARAAGAAARGEGPARAAAAKQKVGVPQRGAAEASAGAKTRGAAKAREGMSRAKARGPATAKPNERRPEPVWAPFPLTEIGMGVGILIFGVGYLGGRAFLISIGAVVLAVVVGELCLREHFTGFRSHALLLAALTVVTVQSLLFAISETFRSPIALAADIAVGAALTWWLRGRFRAARERSGAPAPGRR